MKTAITALKGETLPQYVSVPIPLGRASGLQGRREFLSRPDRQFLHAERVPALRREHQGHRDHGQDRGQPVSLTQSGRPRRPAQAGGAVASLRAGVIATSWPSDRRRFSRMTGRQQALWRHRARSTNVDFACAPRRDPRRARRERRRQVDADQDHRRRRAARPPATMCARRPRRSRFRVPDRGQSKAGIVCVFQELSLLPDLTVADNICITDPPRRFGPDRPRRAARAAPRQLLARVGCEDVHPHGAGQEPAAVAPPDGRDRQGARPRTRSS